MCICICIKRKEYSVQRYTAIHSIKRLRVTPRTQAVSNYSID